jgi:hypothetical protein
MSEPACEPVTAGSPRCETEDALRGDAAGALVARAVPALLRGEGR